MMNRGSKSKRKSTIRVSVIVSVLISTFGVSLLTSTAEAKTASKKAAAQDSKNPATKGAKAKGAAVKLTLSTKGDELYYDKATLTVKAGQSIELTFTNGASSTSGLTHNVTFVKPGTEEQVANAGIQAGPDKGWTPTDSPMVVATTKLVNPGESQTITFQAPDTPGDYPYICTFPGHWVTMKGVLKVTKG